MSLIQILACALYGAIGLALGWDSGLAQAGALILAAAFIYLPFLLGREAERAFASERWRLAAGLAVSRCLFQWDPELRKEARIFSAWARLQKGKEHGLAEIFGGPPTALVPLRWVQVNGLAKLGRHAEATAFFENHLGWPRSVETPNIACLVRSYAEQGRFREAFRALAVLERWRDLPGFRERAMKHLAALPALLGRPELLEGAGLPSGEEAARVLPAEEEALLARWFSAPPPEEGPVVQWRLGRAATLGVLALCAAAFGAGLWMGDGVFAPRISNLLAFGGDAPALVRQGEWWRLVSAIFLHGGLIHLAFNALALWILGEMIEGLFGRRGFWVIFLVSGIAGTGASAWVAKASIAVGASGGVFGLLGAAIGLLLARRRLYPPAYRRALMGQALFLTAANLALGFSIPQVDNTAHMAGLGAGFLLGLLLHPIAMPDCPAWQKRLQAALAGAGVALVLAAGFLAVRNVVDGGYPATGGPMKPVPVPDLGYTMARPDWWVERMEKNTLVWEDRLGIEVLHRGSSRGGIEEAVTLLQEGMKGASLAWLTLGGHRFAELGWRVDEGEERLLYLTEHQGRVTTWQVSCYDGWRAGEVAPLIRRMLSGLIFLDEGQMMEREHERSFVETRRR